MKTINDFRDGFSFEAYQEGAAEKEKQMLRFSEWLVDVPHANGYFGCINELRSLEGAFQFWKDNIDGKEETK